MDLVYADRERKDMGVLKSPELDLAFGSEENDFECKIPLADACCDSGYLIYAEGTEYGGIVDNITVDTASDSVTYSGRTWHGVLGSKCVLPLQEGDAAPSGVALEKYAGSAHPNLFDPNVQKHTYSHDTYTVDANGTITITATTTGQYRCAKIPINIPMGTTVSFRANFSTSGNNKGQIRVGWISKDGLALSGYKFSNTSGNVVTMTIPSPSAETDTLVVWLYVNEIGTAAVGDTATYSEIQVVEGTYTNETMPPYEPYGIAESLVNRYLVISGDANRCISCLVDRVGLSDLFSVPEDDAGVNVSKYQFERYTDAYSGLHNMLASCGMRLNTVHTDGTVMLSAVPAIDYSQEKEFESQLIPFVSKAYKNKVNHLICLGSGELENRLVVHLYADADGNISQTQTFFGVDDYSAIYDYPNAGSGEDVTEAEKRAELIESGTKRFHELRKADTIDIDFDITDDAYYIGDIVGTLDNRTGISVTAEVKKKIVTLKNNHVNISYIVG